MIRTLFIIAGAALVLCAIAFAGAFALGGHDLARNGWAWTFIDTDGDRIRIERVETGNATPTVTRELAWTGGDSLIIESALDVRYVQGAEAGVAITAPEAVAERVRLEDGRLYLDDGGQRFVLGRRERVRIVVTAPSVTNFELRGSGDLTISGYDQPRLSVGISGSGEVEASGQAASVAIRIAGSGEADLEDVVTQRASISIAGSGDARVGPSESADISIAGSGDAILTSRPADIRQRIAGSGRIRQH